MTGQFKDLASKPIRTKDHIIKLLLEAITLLLNGTVIKDEKLTKNYILLRIDKMKRLFFVLDKKIYSIYFPFMIENQKEIKNPLIYDSISDLELNATNLAILKSLYNENTFEQSQGLLDLETELIQILDSFEEQSIQNNIWEILKQLFIFEPGYLRFDYDEKHQNGRFHPLNHLDVNYSSDSTFKIGLNKTIDCESFIDILDLKTESYYITDK